MGGRALGPGAFHWIRRRLPWPGAFITVTAILILLSAAVAEGIGIHAVLGAFLMGVALSQQFEERDQAREVVSQFAISFFAPLYFVAVGLKVNLLEGFDLLLVAVVLAIACVGKLAGAGLGAWLGGMPARRALTVGFAMNARGAIELDSRHSCARRGCSRPTHLRCIGLHGHRHVADERAGDEATGGRAPAVSVPDPAIFGAAAKYFTRLWPSRTP